MKTEAALLVQTGKPLVLAEIEIPALKPGQVLVEIAYSGACGTQVMEWRGDKGEDKWVPHCLGHEGTGTVIETGGAVTKVKAGDKVVLSWIKGSGIEAGGAVYDWDGKKVNAGGVTTSYFEWVQDRMGYFWTEAEVNQRLDHIMTESFRDVVTYAQNHSVNNRIAAYMLAIDRVAYTTRQRGMYA